MSPTDSGPPSTAARSRRTALWGDRGVRTKVLAVTVLGIVTLAVVSAVGIGGMSSVDGKAQQLYRNAAMPLSDLGTLRDMIGDNRVSVYKMLVARTAAEQQQVVSGVADTDKALDAALAQYLQAHRTDLGAQRAALVDEFETRYASWRKIRDEQVFAAAESGHPAAARTAFDGPLAAANDAYAAAMDKLNEIEAAGVPSTASAADRTFHSSRLLMLVVVAVGAVLSLALGLVVAGGLAAGVARVRRVADALAGGDFTRTAGLATRDELGRMGGSLDTAVGNLRELVSSVVASADAVAASSEELSASSAQISASAEETSAQSGVVASAAEEVSRSVQTVAAGADQMGASIREIASNATQASDVANRAVEAAAATSATIGKLGDSSAEIGNVVKVITSIASAVEEQTATTNEMSRSVQEAAGGTGEIAANITGVSTAAGSTTQALVQTRTAVDELSRMAADLRTAVSRFTY